MRVRFGQFIVDAETRQVLRDQQEIHLSTKAFDLLCALVERRPHVVEKAELLRRIWPDTYVLEANLNVLIGDIRRAIDDNPQSPQFIRTVHGIGYAFHGDAVDLDDAPAPGRHPAARFWVVWKNRTFPLSEGNTLIGRHPECGIWLDEPGVSRRHARIHIEGVGRRVVLEDLKSTNGTFVQSARVVTQHILSDGDVIQIGSVRLKFRAWSAEASRETKRIRRKAR